jgi:Na+-transporting NADH:ubiquinone oxidoreductase subunit C
MATAGTKWRERVFTVAFMFATTLVCISILAALYAVTAPTVRRNVAHAQRRAVMEAAGIAAPPSPAAALEIYRQRIRPVPSADKALYYAVMDGASGATNGFVLPAGGAGLWGEIRAMVGLNGALSALTGVTFIKQSETPGLGARIDEPWFKRQFVGKTGPFRAVPEGTHAAAPTEFDAITGATVTTAAVRDLLNRALADAPARVGRDTRRIP